MLPKGAFYFFAASFIAGIVVGIYLRFRKRGEGK